MDTTPRKCEFCGDEYTPRMTLQRYCTVDCRYRQAAQMRFERNRAERDAEAAAGLAQAD